MTMRSTILIGVHFAQVSVLYPRVVISSLAKRLKNIFLSFFTLPLVYSPEITTCHHKGLLHEYVILCYGFLTKSPTCSAKFSLTQVPLAPCVSQAKHCALPHAIEQDTLPIASLIIKQVVPYQTRGDTSYSRGLLLRTNP
jgi:hypothetical protein